MSKKRAIYDINHQKQKSSGRLWKNIRKKRWKNRVGRRLRVINRKPHYTLR